MTLRTISRLAVGSYIKLLRLPLDAAIGLRTRNGQTGPSPATIRLDRVEATLRGAAGRTLRDEELVWDAERRRLAADEREQAARLRAEAQRRSEMADERLSAREEQAEQKRRRAVQQAANRKKKADQRRQAERRRIVAVEARRRRANGEVTAAMEEKIGDRSKRARLQHLNEDADVLAQREKALTTRKESQRLRSAATKTKAARKQNR